MKKLNIKIGLLLSGVLLSVGCNDEFLDRQPLDKITNDSFWNTENDLRVYNNSIYHIARIEDDVPMLVGHDEGFDSQSRGHIFQDGYSDNVAPLHTRQDFYQKKRAGKHAIPTTPEIFGYKGWNFLRAVNVGLENYGKASVTEETRNKYVGEARFLRAWFYADKVAKFGDNQWVDKELNIDDEDILYGERDDREFIMGKVLEDLDFAIQWIPNDWGDGNAPGRLNRWAALHVKARICLFEGTWRKYHGGSNPDMWLQAAADAALEVMEDGPYSLYQSADPARTYNELHQKTDYTGNPEVIVWRRYEAGIFNNHALNYHKGYIGGATKNMVEDYLCTDGLPISLSGQYQGDAVYEDIFENRDPRLRQTIMHPDDQAIYRYGNHDFGVYNYPRIQGTPGGLSSTTGYHIIKVWQLEPSYAAYNVSTTPAIVLRFAETLLTYAEAKAELGTITQPDLDMSINLLRDRVGMPHLDLNPPMDPKYAADGVSSLIVEIRRERRVELFMEGFRYDDLRRWKQGLKLSVKDYGMRWDAANRARFDPTNTATIGVGTVDGVEYLEIYKGTAYESPVFDEGKHYLWPLPTSAISQNPTLGQNPGW
jgi:hypothetical protein